MISRATLYSSVGGDTIQILNTAKYLRYLNVEVDIVTTDAVIHYEEYDLIHFFNIIRPADILPHIALSGKPFVVSTIYVDYSEYEKQNRKGLAGFAFRFLSLDQIEYVKAIARRFINGERIRSRGYLLRGHRRSIQDIAKKSALLLPNSESEYRRFHQNYSVSSPYAVIPNAIDTKLFDLRSTPDPDFTGHILSVARVEGRKNQLNVVKAVADSRLHLDVIGNYSPNHKKYYEACQIEAARGGGRIRFFPHLEQEKLVRIYQAARVHVLASWFETTGLTTLEAALLGCNIVITSKGDTVEYFRDFAYYCDPADVLSIRNAIEKAHRDPYPEALRQHILNHYTWEIAARKTLSAYKSAINGNSV
jgi:glycosyltransferase involved in cell wall biosynthesis